MKKILKVAVLVLVACSFGAIHAFAKPVETPVVFKKGTYGTEVKGNFKGYDDARYTVRAQRGQILKFNILSTRDLAYVNVYAPGDKPGKAEAIYIGSTSPDSTGEIILPETGVYTIQIYQMRNSARLGKAVNFKLDLKILNNIKK
ncbi:MULTISPECIES: DNA breaking-rejoining protein [Acinetobacter]|uniref:DNA breaking-rejoining protein n=1 Tax=Acinetobacter TaxID=469 RepID=UPI0015D1B495|nr:MULTISPECIES: DNA breaking-rejoining protein [Acinetobacter]MCO8103864.1 DNA breaking-rejoining protein [Acinetobacter indicus]